MIRCNRACACWSNCVRTLDLMTKGSSVCEYIGAVRLRDRSEGGWFIPLRSGQKGWKKSLLLGRSILWKPFSLQALRMWARPHCCQSAYWPSRSLPSSYVCFRRQRDQCLWRGITFNLGEKFWVIKHEWFMWECNWCISRYLKEEKMHKTLAPRGEGVAEEQTLLAIDSTDRADLDSSGTHAGLGATNHNKM